MTACEQLEAARLDDDDAYARAQERYVEACRAYVVASDPLHVSKLGDLTESEVDALSDAQNQAHATMDEARLPLDVGHILTCADPGHVFVAAERRADELEDAARAETNRPLPIGARLVRYEGRSAVFALDGEETVVEMDEVEDE